MIHSGLLVIGLLVSWDAILVPLWASLTHQLPSTASLVGNDIIITSLPTSPFMFTDWHTMQLPYWFWLDCL